MIDIKLKFLSVIENEFKALPREKAEPLLSENVLSPFVLNLDPDVLRQAQAFVKALFKMRSSSHYIEEHSLGLLKEKGISDPGNKSILMSYDFHLNEEGTLKLIEVNTNAAFLAMGDLLYKSQGIKQPISDFNINEISKNIEKEMELQNKELPTPFQIVIIDEQPENQKLYLEFLIYQEIFKREGWHCLIKDYRDLPKNVDFIYNRLTDFYLEKKDAFSLKEKFSSRKICFSPNPFEYSLLADKDRLIDWSNEKFLFNSYGLTEQEFKTIDQHLPRSYNLTEENKDFIWAKRKAFFFKPKRSFGSKQAYRGQKISKKLFEEISSSEFICQEYIPAPEISFETPEGLQSYKYDLRFYVYQDRVQSVLARLYQGQLTNSQTKWGGFAAIQFK